MLIQRILWILWPAFLMAGVMEMAVFAFVDPEDLHWLGQPIDLPRQGIYTLAFFGFWAMAAGSSALTTWLAVSPFEVNRCPLPGHERPDGCPKQVCGHHFGGH